MPSLHKVSGQDQLTPFGALHGFDGVPYEIEQNLLDLNFIGEDKIMRTVEAKLHAGSPVFGPYEREGARLFHELDYALNSPLALSP